MCEQSFEAPDIEDCYSEPIVYGAVPGTGVVLAGDVDLDGHQDVIVPGAAGGIAVWKGDGAGGLSGPVLTPSDAAQGAALGDLDADGRLDLVISVIGPPARIDLLMGDGAGGFVVETSFASGVTVGKDVATGDFDGDGDLDAVALHQGLGSQHRQRLSTITSHDGEAWTYADQPLTMLIDDILFDVWTPLLATGNFDGVHNDVIVTTIRSVEVPRLLRSNGLGTFTYEGPLGGDSGLVGMAPVIAFDVDDDGDNDVLGPRQIGSSLRYRENLGGAWGPNVDTMLLGSGLIMAAIGALIHTPRPDLVLMKGNGSSEVLTIELGGKVVFPSLYGFHLPPARGYTLTDLNEDGLSDFVYVPLNGPQVLSLLLSQ